jgi:hypothetical protein
MHQFVCRCRLAHVVQLKRIARLGFQILGINHARPTQTAVGKFRLVSRESLSDKIHMIVSREECGGNARLASLACRRLGPRSFLHFFFSRGAARPDC